MTHHLAAADPDAVVGHVRPHGHVIVPLGNGEPVALLDALERAADDGAVEGVQVHQMHALRDRPYLHGEHGDRLRHVSY
ncbi:MAG: propionyl-CoA--succinate CoA transferase, partial [Ilumatobacteraceae bacterium]